MKIARKINGEEMEFTLTSNELWNAYCEQQAVFDQDNVEIIYPNNRFNANEVEAIAAEARRQMDKYDVSWDFAITEAVSDLGLSDKAYA